MFLPIFLIPQGKLKIYTNILNGLFKVDFINN